MKSRVVLLLVLVTVVAFTIGVRHGRRTALQTAISRPASDVVQLTSAPDLSTFWKVWDLLGENYLEPSRLDSVGMVYGAIRGLAASLGDPYTAFLDPTETKAFAESLRGELQGIGAEIEMEDQALTIVSPLKNSPASRAGLLPGDVIYKIDDAFAADMTLFEAIQKIRGPKGTKVTLSILRKQNGREPFDVTIVREKISVPSVTWERKGHAEQLVLLSVNQFNEDTTKEFRKAVTELLLANPKGIIVDLRNNGGGYLDIAVDIVSEFLPGKKEVVRLIRRNGKENEQVFTTSGHGRLLDLPLVILANKGSASASEIVAGAMQDLKRGLILGEQTFGKGTVQEVEELPDGSSLRLTVAKWLTPNSRDIDTTGISPDQLVTMTSEDAKNERDPQLDAAVGFLER